MVGRRDWAALACLTAAGIGGCAVGPDFKRPEPPPVARYASEPLARATASAPVAGGEAQQFFSGRDIPGDWWTLFGSEPLDRLIARALRNNPDIEAAQAAVREAQENLLASRGALFPTADAAIQGERERLAGAVIGQPKFTPTFSVLTASVNIVYAPDVFGRARRQIESAAAQAEASRFELEATYLTLTTNIVVAAVQEAALRATLEATEQIAAIESDALGLVRQRFAVGVVSQADVLLQEATLDQTRAALPTLRKQLAQACNAVTALAGDFPSEPPAQGFSLDGLTLPRQLPVSVPAKLVEQRPDVRGAEALWHAASAAVGVATANQLPQFSIAAGGGAIAAHLADFPGTPVWNLSGGVTQTLFDAGTLKHRKRAAVAAFTAAGAEYRGVVLKALQNVADVLQALQADAEALAAQNAAERSAYASLTLAQQQFAAETADYLTVLSAQRAWQQARLALVQARADRYSDTAALFQALGGGWWQRADASAAEFSAPR